MNSINFYETSRQKGSKKNEILQKRSDTTVSFVKVHAITNS